MQYLSQFLIILLFTFLGESCAFLIPLPIPAAVYGLVLLFLALQCRLVKLEQVRTVGSFLVSILGILFVAPVVNLMDRWKQLAPDLAAILATVTLTTLLVFGAAGLVCRLLRGKECAHG